MDRPFAFDKIPAGPLIVGRGEEIDCILSALGPGGKSLAIYGGIRCGKETVVTEALERHRARKKNVIVCDIDLTGVRTPGRFIELWRKKMGVCAEEVNRGALLPFEIPLHEIPDGKIFDLPGIIASEAGAQVVVYFKEFQNLLRLEDEHFRLESLDKAWSRQHSVRYLMTGSLVNAMKQIFLERKCFYGMSRTLELRPVDRRLVCEYIQSTFLSFGRVIEMEEALAIDEIAAGNMWYVNQLCSLCYDMPAGYVNRKIVNQARDRLLAIHVPHFKQMMLDLTANQINLLHAVSDGVRKPTSAENLDRYALNSSAGVVRSKEALVRKELITFDDEDSPRIIDPVFAWWLRNHYFN